MKVPTALALILCLSVVHANSVATWSAKGRLCVVTGAARGIGYVITENLLQRGATVIMVDINQKVGERARRTLASTYGENKVHFVYGNVNTDLHRVFNIIKMTWGVPTLLINNAGIVNEYELDLTMETNCLSPIRWTYHFIDEIKKAKNREGATVVTVTDVYAHIIDAFLPAYRAAYSGATSFCETIGHPYNYKQTGVRVFATCLGFTKTQMTAAPMEISGRDPMYKKYARSWDWQEPDYTGQAIVQLLETAQTGQSYTIDGGKTYKTPNSKKYYSAEYIEQFEDDDSC